jgi:4-amino-4-deoxy-L-arabinose transferase-like glycosyltransferase
VKARFRVLIVSTLLALGTAALYLPRLEDAPRYLVTDEVFSALTAHSVATTGRDPHGAFLPLYFQMDLPKGGRPMWFQPILVYAMATVLQVAPLSEGAIRLPMAIAGVVNVVLIYLVGRQLFGRELLAIAAAVMLAVTPAHFMYSRYAMDFQAPLPFVLGWLLCLVTYVKMPSARLLFAAGVVLGAGIYSYIAAVALMPLYLLLTCIVLLLRRERVSRYAILAAGFVLPVLLTIPVLLNHPTLLRDIAAHYQPDGAPATAGAADSFATLFSSGSIADALALYARFWNPRFLFIDGPLRSTEATWLVGVFLLPLAGLLLIGVVRALRRPLVPVTLVLMAGLVTAPIPASFAGQTEAIRRAVELIPFAVLIGIVGLEAFWATKASAVRSIAFVAFWGVVVALAVASHGHVPQAQAYVRAASVPLAIAALALVVDRLDPASLRRPRVLIAVLVALAASQIAYYLSAGLVVSLALAGLFAAVASMRRNAAAPESVAVAAVLFLAVLSSELTFHYVDYPIPRVGPVPATALVLTVRLAAAALALAAACAVASAARSRADRSNAEVIASVAVVAALVVQVAYFYVDLFANPVLRFAHVAVIVAGAAGVAAWWKTDASSNRLGPLTAVGLLGLAALQFGYFYKDYFTSFQARGSGAAVGNVRIALETTLDAVGDRPVPAIYLARLRNESPGLGATYAKFYLLKKNRQDLVARTAEGDDYMGFEVDRVAALPPGSLVIVNPSTRNEQAIDRLTAAGELKRDQLIKTPDGTPMFWILERTAR